MLNSVFGDTFDPVAIDATPKAINQMGDLFYMETHTWMANMLITIYNDDIISRKYGRKRNWESARIDSRNDGNDVKAIECYVRHKTLQSERGRNEERKKE